MTSAEIVVEVSGSTDQALDFYEQALSALGWRTQSQGGISSGGFQGPPPTRNSLFCPPSGNETVSLMLFPRGAERTTVRATVSLPAPAAAGVPRPYRPCSAPPVPMPTPVASPLPELTPPPGVRLASLPTPPPMPPGAPDSPSAPAGLPGYGFAYPSAPSTAPAPPAVAPSVPPATGTALPAPPVATPTPRTPAAPRP